MESLISIGRLLCRVGDAEESEGVLRDALAVAEDMKSRPLIYEACEALAHSCELRGMNKEGLRYYKRFHSLKEEVFNEESTQKTRNLQMLYKVEQARQESEIYRLRTVELSAANQEILRQQHVLSQQTEELHAQNLALQEVVRDKNQLIAIVAHDLKNPLSGIVLTTSNLQRNHLRMNSVEITSQLDIIERTSKRMKVIIHKLLDLHAIESNRMNLNLECLNLCESVQQVVERYHPRALEKGMALHVDVEAALMPVQADENALQQIIENLLSNAMKFSPAGTNVTLRCKRDAEAMLLEICDEGPGIDDTDRVKLFEKFAKISNRPTGGEESTGLGLSIVQQLCNAMGMTIEQRNLPERGSLFSVRCIAC